MRPPAQNIGVGSHQEVQDITQMTLKCRSALCFIPDASEGNVDGGIALTGQVVTTHVPGSGMG